MMIRNAHATDLPELYVICDRTGFQGGDASSVVAERNLLGHYFAAPYLIHDASWCWVAEDDHGLVGYLVATAESGRFAQWMQEQWLPALRRRPLSLPSLSEFDAWLRRLIHEVPAVPDFLAEYPSHFHIDLLPRAQGRGLGTQLVNRFLAQLSTQQISGFHLGVSVANTRALQFYDKQGFQTIRRDPGVVYVGLRTEVSSSTTSTPSFVPSSPATRLP